MQMDGTRKFVDVAKEAMGKSENDKLVMGVGVGDVRKTLEFIVKTTKVRYRFEWKKLKGLHATKKSWNMHSFKSGIVNRRGQYVVCGQAKRKSVRHESLCKKLAGLNGQDNLSADLYVASETKGNCDHAMGIVSEGEGGECRLFDNTWTGNGNSKLYTMNSFASSLSNAQCCYFFNLIEL